MAGQVIHDQKCFPVSFDLLDGGGLICYGLFRAKGWKQQCELCSVFIRRHKDFSPVVENRIFYYGQAKTGAGFTHLLLGEKGIKNFIQVIFRYSLAGIQHFKHHIFAGGQILFRVPVFLPVHIMVGC